MFREHKCFKGIVRSADQITEVLKFLWHAFKIRADSPLILDLRKKRHPPLDMMFLGHGQHTTNRIYFYVALIMSKAKGSTFYNAPIYNKMAAPYATRGVHPFNLDGLCLYDIS